VWLKRKAEMPDTYRKDAGASIEVKKTRFGVAVQRARTTGSSYDGALVEYVVGQLDSIGRDIAEAETEEQVDALVQRAENLEPLSAYVWPESEIRLEGEVDLVTLSEWGVPDSLIAKYREAFASKLSESNTKVARGALYILFAELNEWSDYLDEYNEVMRRSAAWLLTAVISLSLLGAFLLWHGFVIWGLFTAGVSGSCASVLARMPALSNWGENGHAICPAAARRTREALVLSLRG
jgi:hypothetical protein